MSTQATTRLDPSHVALRLGMCAAALAGTAATVQDADAAIVTVTGPIVIPNDVSGVYINLLTGATDTGAFSGWDFNPYLAGSGTQLGFYWAPSPTGTSGGVATATTGGAYIDLAPGSTISAASIFARSILATTGSPFVATGTHTLGFRFYNENTAATNYGYLTMTNTATNGFPATILGWSYDDSGAAITVSAVPEAPTSLMLTAGALALGAVQLRKLRRQRKQAAH